MNTPAQGRKVQPIGRAPIPGAPALECRSRPQMCALGPPPPRTPGRADPQVPTVPGRGAVRHGRIPHLYFYLGTRSDDAAFGFLDLEIAVREPSNGRSAVELYCVGDGYQSGSGRAQGETIDVELRSEAGVVAVVRWPWPEVVSGRAEAMCFSTSVEMTDSGFAALDRATVPAARGWTVIEMGS